MDILRAHPELAPEVFQTHLAPKYEECHVFVESPVGCDTNLRKIAQIESDLLELQGCKDSELQALQKYTGSLEPTLINKRTSASSKKASMWTCRDRWIACDNIASESATWELSCALEERYLAIRTQEMELQEQRGTYERRLETLAHQKEAWALTEVEIEKRLAELHAPGGAAEAEETLREEVEFLLASTVILEWTRLRTFSDAVTAADQRQSLLNEALFISDTHQAELDKFARESQGRILTLEEKRLNVDNRALRKERYDNYRAIRARGDEERTAEIDKLIKESKKLTTDIGILCLIRARGDEPAFKRTAKIDKLIKENQQLKADIGVLGVIRTHDDEGRTAEIDKLIKENK
ncbi:hypothetical protein C8R44DRAFT_886412 [Mycena epipterygia]|nr:hypothetical protein C8R44DRAFT_886412 [Mycena epipterygia]